MAINNNGKVVAGIISGAIALTGGAIATIVKVTKKHKNKAAAAAEVVESVAEAVEEK